VHRAIQFHHSDDASSASDPLVQLVRHVNRFTHAPAQGGAELQQSLGLNPDAFAELQAFARQAQAGIVL
jgi:hypothetical protein